MRVPCWVNTLLNLSELSPITYQGPLGETEAHLSRVKRSRLSVVIGRFRSILFVSVFQGSLAVTIIMIDGSKKPNHQLGFELQSSRVIENRNNATNLSIVLFIWTLPSSTYNISLFS